MSIRYIEKVLIVCHSKRGTILNYIEIKELFIRVSGSGHIRVFRHRNNKTHLGVKIIIIIRVFSG